MLCVCVLPAQPLARYFHFLCCSSTLLLFVRSFSLTLCSGVHYFFFSTYCTKNVCTASEQTGKACVLSCSIFFTGEWVKMATAFLLSFTSQLYVCRSITLLYSKIHTQISRWMCVGESLYACGILFDTFDSVQSLLSSSSSCIIFLSICYYGRTIYAQ